MPKLRIDVGVLTKGMKEGFSRVMEKVRSFNAGLKKIPLFGQIAGAFGLTSAISRIKDTLVESVSEARRFQRQMSEINTVARLSGNGLSMLSGQVKDLSVELGVSTDTLTSGLYEALSAEVPPDNAIDFLRTATKAAVSGVTSIEVAVDGLTSVINAYKMDVSEARHVSDIFFETIRLGKTRFEQLSQNIGLVLPMAAALGLSFEEVGAALATMTKQGLSTDKAATSLRGIMQDLLKPGEELIAVIRKIEKEQQIAALSSLDFQTQLRLIGEAVGGNKQMLAKLFPNIRSFTGFLQLIGKNAKGAAADLNIVRNSIGAMEKAFAEFADKEDIKLSKIEQKWARIKRWFGTNLLKGLVLVSEPFLAGDAETKLEDKLKKYKFFLEETLPKVKKERALTRKEQIQQSIAEIETSDEYRNLSVNIPRGVFGGNDRPMFEQYNKYLERAGRKLKEINETEKKAREAGAAPGTADSGFTSAADITIQNQIRAMAQQIELQKMLNAGKEKEAFIQEALNRGMNAAGELSKNELDKIKKLAAEQFDLEQGSSKKARLPDKTEFSSIQRIGGNIARLANFSPEGGGVRETNAKLAALQQSVSDINTKIRSMPPTQYSGQDNNLAR